MVLRLDQGIPQVWRSPDVVQFGIDRPLALITDVSTADERMVEALGGGVTRSGLSMIGRHAGATEAEVVRLLAALRPVLLPRKPVSNDLSPRIVIDGSGRTADHLAIMLQAGGCVVNDGSGPDTADLAVIVAHYAIAPERFGVWLRRDIPHLAIVFGDRGVRIGPLVEPGITPCLYCSELAHTDDDPAWPAMAAQLYTRTAPAESRALRSLRLRPGRSWHASTGALTPTVTIRAHSLRGASGSTVKRERLACASTSRTRTAAANLCQET
jgi:hypothetical protein